MINDLAIMPATEEMLSDIVRLEETCFSSPWTRKMIEAELTGNQFARFLVAREAGGTIVAYHCFCALYQGMGFVPAGTRPKYYANPVEDAVIMEMDPLVLNAGAV